MKYHFKITFHNNRVIQIYKIATDSQEAVRSLNNISNIKSIEIVSVKHTLRDEKC